MSDQHPTDEEAKPAAKAKRPLEQGERKSQLDKFAHPMNFGAALLALVTAIVGGFLVLKQQDDQGPREPETSAPASPSASPEATTQTSTEETPPPEDSGTEGAAESATTETDPTTAETTGGGGDNGASNSGTVPNVIGMNTVDAQDQLRSAGFTDIVGVAEFNGTFQICGVYDQEPDPESVVDFDTQIVLYHEPDQTSSSDGCQIDPA